MSKYCDDCLTIAYDNVEYNPLLESKNNPTLKNILKILKSINS